MKTFKSPSGPFVEQPYYTPNDVEAICSDELQKLGFYPSDPSPIRIDRFIEKRFNLQPTYEDLPNGLLGFTRFSAKGVEEIVITTALDEEGTRPAERRLRTTLAHEGGHGLLHAHLLYLVRALMPCLEMASRRTPRRSSAAMTGPRPRALSARPSHRTAGGSSRPTWPWAPCCSRKRWLRRP